MKTILYLFLLWTFVSSCKKHEPEPVVHPELSKASRHRIISNIIPLCVGAEPSYESFLNLTFTIEEKDLFTIDSIFFSGKKCEFKVQQIVQGQKDSIMVEASYLAPALCDAHRKNGEPYRQHTYYNQLDLYYTTEGINSLKEFKDVEFSPDTFEVMGY